MTDMTTREVAEALGVTYQTILNYTERKLDALPIKSAQRHGLKTIRTYDSADVVAWAARNNVPCSIDG